MHKAKTLGLRGISITDHDAILSDEDINYGRNVGLKIIPGIEFSTLYHNVHIIGYGLSSTNSDLIRFISIECEKRKIACQKMCERTFKFNIPVSFEEVLKEKNNIEGALGRPHIAAVMLKKGYVKTSYEAFGKWLGKGRSIYVGYDKFEHSEIVKKIIGWNGIPVIAHFGLVHNEKVFYDCLSAGLQGIEVYYPRHTSEQTQHLLELANKNNLLITGGSDFHGVLKPDIRLGDAGLKEADFLKLAKWGRF